MATLIDPSFGWRSHRKGTSTFMIVETVACNSSGAWTLDLTSFNLASIVSVSATAIATGTAITAQPYASIHTTSATSITGYIVVPATILLGGNGSTFAPNGTTAYIQVWAIPKKPLT